MTSPSPSEAATEIAEALEFKRTVAPKLIEALKFLGFFAECVECDKPGTRYFTTEGDGPYWLCDSTDENHAMPERYAAETETRCDWAAALLLAGVKP